MSRFKNIPLLAVLTLTALCCPAHAKLGDTPDQCIARFGQPIEKVIKDPNPVGQGDLICTFRKDGYIVVITIFNGTVGAETIWKEDKSVIADFELTAILGKDTSGGKWFRAKDLENGGNEAFIREDKALATYDLKTYVLNVYSADYYTASQAKK